MLWRLVYCQCLQHILRCHLQQLQSSLPSCGDTSLGSLCLLLKADPANSQHSAPMVCLVATPLSHQLDKAWSLLCVQSKSQQRKLVQSTIDAKSLGLLKMLVMGPDLKLSCSGCFLHGIVADAPLELLVTLMKAAGTALNTQHPILKTYVIHEVPLHVTNGQSRCMHTCYCSSKNNNFCICPAVRMAAGSKAAVIA